MADWEGMRMKYLIDKYFVNCKTHVCPHCKKTIVEMTSSDTDQQLKKHLWFEHRDEVKNALR